MQVAQTILSQLGGSRFVAMTGAKNLVAGHNSLSMHIGQNAKKVTHVRIRLDPSDTYTVEFVRISKSNFKVLTTVSDVYCDMLQEIFTQHTGLHTSL
jgi:hypothetical protein